MFDRSFLAPADLEFVVMTDTHYMLDPGMQRIEFESRRRQSARSGHTLGQIASLDTAFVVHLGDLVQEFPESEGFAESLGQALSQIEASGVRPRQVAGNHDVGDKPDPTMPTDWVSAETLRQYHDRFGPSWCGWDGGGCHFVILNSQIMNGPLPDAEIQQRWLERDLEQHGGKPTFVFLHLSPFLVSENEQALGHYDNIDEPVRGWLLDIIRKYDVRMLFSGHSHFAFFNRVGDARLYVVPSTSFTRPGFCEVFSSASPPERGRDDAAKLGFFLVRVGDDRASVHLIRTDGAISDTVKAQDERRVITRTSQELAQSPLGLTLRHPIAPSAEVPIAWQSTIRQPVRNDYPLLACVELGVRHVRVPAADLSNAAQRERLVVLRDEGVSISATWIWSGRRSLLEEIAAHHDVLDGIELQIPSSLHPDAACLRAIKGWAEASTVPVTLSPLLPKEIVPGKQHARTRTGYHLGELAELDQFLGVHDARIDRVLCRVDANQSAWEAITRTRESPALDHIDSIDWAVEFGESDNVEQVSRASETMFAAATLNGSRVFMEPLVDLDRTMDAPLGLVDRLCNPRPAFHAVRLLNTILFGEDRGWTPGDCRQTPDAIRTVLHGAHMTIMLVVPNANGPGTVAMDSNNPQAIAPAAERASLIRLAAGTSRPVELTGQDQLLIQEASVIIFERTAD